MNRITSPLRIEGRGPRVADLQDGLRFILEQELLSRDDGERQELLDRLRPEREESTFGAATKRLVEALQARQQMRVTGVVDERTADSLNAVLEELGVFELAGPEDELDDGDFIVRGTVRNFDGDPVREGMVRAHDKDMRTEELLGEVGLDQRGRYAIRYTPERFARAEKGNADLRVCLCNDEGREIVSSGIIFNAPREAVVNLVVPQRGKSEIEIIREEVDPVVRQRVPVAELTDEDLDFLAPETGIEHELLVLLVISEQLGRRLEVEPDLLYALFRTGLPTTVAGLLAAGPPAHRRRLETALDRNLVPQTLGERRAERLEALQRALLKAAESPEFEEERPPLLRALKASNLGADSVRQIFDRVVRQEQDGTDVWSALREELPAAEVEEVATAIRLDLLTGGNEPLTHELHRQRAAGEFSSIEELADIEPAQWREMVRGLAVDGKVPLPWNVPGATVEERIDRYVEDYITAPLHLAFTERILARELRRAPEIDLTAARGVQTVRPGLDPRRPLPQAVIEELAPDERESAQEAWSHLGAELRAYPELDVREAFDGETFVNPIRQGVGRMLENAPELADLRKTSISNVIAERGEDEVFAGISTELRGPARRQLEATQRIQRIVPRADDTSTLLEAGFRDAPSIARTTPRHFADLVGESLGGEERAIAIRRVAQRRAATAEMIYTSFKDTEVLPYAIRGILGPTTPDALQEASKPQSDKIWLEQLWQEIQGGPKAKGDRRPTAGETVSGRPDITTLFGAQDYCECARCESVYSPAAYLVDLLNFLDVRASKASSETALDILLGRRPDIARLRLSCENTLTPLPYIDLVNEVLESYIVSAMIENEQPPAIPAFDVGQSTAEELRAAPQHIEPRAYDELKKAVYPLSLPFDSAFETVRAYLGQLGTGRAAIRRALPPFDEQAQEAHALDILGLSRAEHDLIVSEPAEPWILYGYVTDTVGSESWQDNVASAPVFLERTGLELEELIMLLLTEHLNPELAEARQITPVRPRGIEVDLPWLRRVISAEKPAEQTPTVTTLHALTFECDLNKYGLRWPDETTRDSFLIKANALLRLERRLPWSIMELDRIIASLGGTITGGVDGTIVKLAAVRELQDRLGQMKLSELLVLWAAIDTWQDDSLYDRVFLRGDPTANGAHYAFALAKDRRELLKAMESLEKEPTRIAVQLALRLNPSDFDTLLTTIKSDLVLNDDDEVALNLANLSKLYRHVALARALRIRIPELLGLLALAEADPFTSADPRETLKFVDLVTEIQNTSFDVRALLGLLQDKPHPGYDPRPVTETIKAILDGVSNALRAAAAELSVSGVDSKGFDHESSVWADADPLGEVLRERLARAITPVEPTEGTDEQEEAQGYLRVSTWEPSQFVDTAVGILTGNDAILPPLIPLPDSMPESQPTPHTKALELFDVLFESERVSEFVDLNGLEEARNRVADLFPADPDDPATSLEETERQKLAEANIGWLYEQLMPWLWKKTASNVVTDALSNTLDLEPAVMRLLLDEEIHVPPASGSDHSAMQILIGLLNEKPDSGHHQLITRLHLAALLVRSFELDEKELKHLSDRIVDLDNFTVVGGLTTTERFAQWRDIARYVRLKKALPRTGLPLIDLLEEVSSASPPLEEVKERWIELSGWSAQEVEDLTGQEGLGFDVADFGTVTHLLRLLDLRAIHKRAGMPVARLRSWVNAEPDATQAAEVIDAVRAKYEDEQWLDVARTLNDPLREARRDALVAYLLPRLELKDSSELFEHFLLDVEMTSCMSSSRVKQATLSTQLFVQRCLMNLEPHVNPDAIDAERWKTQGTYRIWEANRKVFLYAENWIEPELRLEKSPFFRDLESQLFQNELTEQNVERACAHYLQKLDEVARLEISGFAEEVRLAADKIVHVFGRTANPPRRYFYRRLIGDREWTAWEPVELDIQGDHLIPLIFQGRLILFWAVFNEKPMPNQDAGSEQAADVFYEIRIFWSEYQEQDGRWSAPESADEAIESYPWKAVVGAQTRTERPPVPPEPLGKDKFTIDTIDVSVIDALTGVDWEELIQKSDRVRQRVRDWAERYDDFVNDELPFASGFGDGKYPPLPPPLEDPPWSAGPGFWGILDTFRLANYNGAALWWNNTFGMWLGQYTSWYKRYSSWAMDNTNTIEDISETDYGLPAASAHTFRVVAVGDNLKVDCFVETGEQNDLPRVNRVGGFRLESCRGELKVTSKVPIWTEHLQRVQYRMANSRELTRARDSGVSAQSFTFSISRRELVRSGRWGPGGSYDSSAGRDLQLEMVPSAVVLRIPGREVRLAVEAQDVLLAFPDTFFHSDVRNVHFVEPARRPPQSTFGELLRTEPGLRDGINFLRSEFQKTQINPSTTDRFRGAHVAISRIPSSSLEPASPSLRTRSGVRTSRTARQLDIAPSVLLMDLYRDTTMMLNADLFRWETVSVLDVTGLRFSTFHHPFVCHYMTALRRGGVDALLTLANQQLPTNGDDNTFDTQYSPTEWVVKPHPKYDVDFEPRGAYSLYNWELFFHVPMLIAERLRQEARHREAQKWYHYILNPLTDDTTEDVPHRFWNFLPFRANTAYERVSELIKALGDPDPDTETAEIQRGALAQVEEWERHPFEPHRIARLRFLAYQKNVCMRYIQNVIDWGDLLFRRFTMESVNEATQLYVLAAQMLGERPRAIPALADVPPPTFAELRPNLADAGAFSNPLVPLENAIVELPFSVEATEVDHADEPGLAALALAFCVPHNEQLLSYWDTVEDRLFKIRHCLDIEGVERQLALFEPPIDPALLVKAVAAGLDLGSVLTELHAPLPHYRFQVLMPKAHEFTGEVKALGGTLLAALEKRDAEELAALRARHETTLLRAIKDVRKQQVDEAEESLRALEQSRLVAETREAYYRKNIEDALSAYEQLQLDNLEQANQYQASAARQEKHAQMASRFPTLTVTTSGIPSASASYGGRDVAGEFYANAREYNWLGTDASYRSNMAALEGGHERRHNEWAFQQSLATHDITQIEKQIAAAEIRKQIAELELRNLEKQIEHATEVENFLRYKYTNQELYNWMASQVSTVYYQAYKLAFDMAKRAERAFRFERGVQDTSYIQFGYWEGGRKGLLAGERLAHDLRRLEAAYLEENRREYEITKHVSLVLHDPRSLIELKETGRCELDLPEALFDADYPGHYFRRCKSVALSIPAVVGQYTSINCTLTLLKSKIRKDPKATDAEDYLAQHEDRFLYDFAPVQRIVTSHGQNDAGIFELNFRDERYLPYEGAGADSRWRIELPKDTNAFDLDSISDVVLTLRYTARDGGARLADVARKALDKVRGEWTERDGAQPMLRMFDLRHEFPDEWHAFLNPREEAPKMRLPLTRERFPFLFRGRVLTIHKAQLFLRLRKEDQDPPSLRLRTPSADSPAVTEWAALQKTSHAHRADFAFADSGVALADGSDAAWLVEGEQGDSYRELVDSLVLIVEYSAKRPGPS